MIKLYNFGPFGDLPDPSHFCVKVDAYLRMTDQPFEVVSAMDNLKIAPKGKLPFIEDNGEKVAEFEGKFAAYTKSEFCVGVANGTDALEIAVRALELPAGSEIITQGNTFAATAFSISNNGIIYRRNGS